MRTAIDGIDGIRKRIYRLGICIRVLNGGLDTHPFYFLFNIHHRVQIITVAVEITDKRSDTTFKVEGHLAVAAFIHELNGYTARHKRHFTEALDECIETIIDIFCEDLFVELKGLPRAAFILRGFADLLYFALRHTALVVLLP